MRVIVTHRGRTTVGRVVGDVRKRTCDVRLPDGRVRKYQLRDVLPVRHTADELTRRLTTYRTFDELLDARWCPTLYGGGLQRLLANGYDVAQEVRGCWRRAYTEDKVLGPTRRPARRTYTTQRKDA